MYCCHLFTKNTQKGNAFDPHIILFVWFNFIVFQPGTRKKAAEIIRLGPKKEVNLNDDITTHHENTIVPIVEELHIDDQRTLEMVAQFAEQAAKATNASDVSKKSNFIFI